MTSFDLAPVATTFMGLGVLAMIVGRGRLDGIRGGVTMGCFAASVLVAIVAAWLR